MGGLLACREQMLPPRQQPPTWHVVLLVLMPLQGWYSKSASNTCGDAGGGGHTREVLPLLLPRSAATRQRYPAALPRSAQRASSTAWV